MGCMEGLHSGALHCPTTLRPQRALGVSLQRNRLQSRAKSVRAVTIRANLVVARRPSSHSSAPAARTAHPHKASSTPSSRPNILFHAHQQPPPGRPPRRARRRWRPKPRAWTPPSRWASSSPASPPAAWLRTRCCSAPARRSSCSPRRAAPPARLLACPDLYPLSSSSPPPPRAPRLTRRARPTESRARSWRSSSKIPSARRASRPCRRCCCTST